MIAAVPTLDAIAQDPELVRELPRAVLGELLERVALVQARLMWAVHTAAMCGTQSADDDLLDVHAAAALIGISPLTLSHKRKLAPYAAFVVPTGTRNLRFSRRAIVQWREQFHAGSSPTTPAGPSEERKARKSPRARHPDPEWLRPGRGVRP